MRSESELLREALIGSVSHELRTPLASILGATTVLSNRAHNPEATRGVFRVARGGEAQPVSRRLDTVGYEARQLRPHRRRTRRWRLK
jgi:K+-sensing histidine kinase KdpD